MTKRTKIAMWCLSHLCVAVFAFLAGVAVELRYGKQSFAQIAGDGPLLQWFYPQYVELQREHGGYEQYRDALLDFDPVQELAQANVLLQVPHGGRIYHVGRMLNYTRLSRLESRQGTTAEAERYLALAVEECALAEWEDCTPETPVRFLDLLEQFRRDKEADVNIWTGPKNVRFPPR